MKQEDVKYAKEITPIVENEINEKNKMNSEKVIGLNDDYPDMNGDKAKLRRKSTLKEIASEGQNNFEIFKKFEIDENIKNQKLSTFIDDYRVQTLFMVLTIYTLFGDDFRLFSSGKDSDMSYDAFTIFAFAMFTGEIVISIMAYHDYLWSYFFTLDTLSTFSLILDIVLLRDEIL